MAETAQVAESVSILAGQEGKAAFDEYFEREIRGVYLPRLQKYRADLDALYTDENNNNIFGTQENNTVANRMAYMRKEAKKIRDDVLNMLTVSPIGNAEIGKKSDRQRLGDLLRQLDEEDYQQQLDKLKAARKTVYSINGQANQEKFKKIALEAMSTVYELRALLSNGIEEDIGITFPQGGYMRLIRIPMSVFLNSSVAMEMISVVQGSALDTIAGDPWQLKMNFNNSILGQLQNLAKQNGGSVSENMIVNIRTNQSNGQYVKREVNLADMYENLIKSKVIRPDNEYDVYERGASGFVAEALVEAFVTGNGYEYSTDKIDWYKKPDVEYIDENGNVRGISVKNAIGASPTLLRINSLNTVLQKLIKALSGGYRKTPQGIINYIRKNIFDLDPKVNNYLEKEIAQSLHI